MCMSRIILFLLLMPVLFLTCQSAPKAVEEIPPAQITEPAEEAPPAIQEPEAAAPEEPSAYNVTQELYDQTLAEVKAFIEKLNIAINSKNFNGWRAGLSSERLAEVSSAQFLKEQSESPLLKTRNIVLRSANDYFLQVVVPSRANSKVDEIDFVDESNVKAFFLETRNQRNENNEVVPVTRRLLLYELTKTGNEWKIKR